MKPKPVHEYVRALTAGGRPLQQEIERRGRDSLRGDWLLALDGVPELALAWARAVSLPDSIWDGSRFKCFLPGHRGCQAKLWLDDRGVYVYQCNTRHDGRETWTLTEAWLAHRIGRVWKLTATSLPKLKRWMLAELRFVELRPIELPPLQEPVAEWEDSVYRFLVTWFGVRQLADEPREGVPLVPEFMAPLAGVTEDQFARARRRFKREGVIREVGHAGRAKLWRPGVVPI